jgi:hypothetical protein
VAVCYFDFEVFVAVCYFDYHLNLFVVLAVVIDVACHLIARL